MTVLARRKITKKPVRRRPAAKQSRSFGKIGWLAAAALAIGWVASDGRTVSYVASFVPRAETRVAAASRPAAIRQATLRTSASADPETRRATADRTRVPEPFRSARPPAVVPTHVAAIAPSPAPRLVPMRMPQDRIATTEIRRPAAPMLPAMRPPIAAPLAERSTVAAPMAAAVPPAGGMRHATRLLVMRDSPDDAGKHVGSVVSGMQVEVLRAAGHWRYVRADSGEGWVDGTYLAGEAAALETPSRPAILAAIPAAPVARVAESAPVPPMAISTR